MTRITRKEVSSAFERLAKALGKPTGKVWEKQPDGTLRATVGAWILDYAPMYGGYNVEEIFNDRGAIIRPLSETRMSGREFVDAVYFALCVLEVWRESRIQQ